MLSKVLSVAFLLAATAFGAEPPWPANPDRNVETVGSGFVIQLYKGHGVSPDVVDFLRQAPLPKYPDGSSFHEIYFTATAELGTAFEIAERGYGGQRSVVKKRDTKIILYPSALPYAGCLHTANSYTVFVSSAFIDLVRGVAGAMLLDARRGRGEATPDGIGFDDWMQMLRAGKTRNDLGNITFPGPRPPLKEEWIVQNITVPTVSVLTFVMAHELAHLDTKLNSKRGPEGVDVEIDVDRRALNAAQDHVVMPFVVGFTTAWWYCLETEAPKIQAELARLGKGDIPTAEITGGTSWRKRSAALISEWEQLCQKTPAPKIALPGWKAAVEYSRQLIAAEPPLTGGVVIKQDGIAQALDALLTAAPTKFESLRGARKSGGENGKDEIFDLTQQVPDAVRTELTRPSNEHLMPSVSCYFVDGTADRETALKSFDSVVAAITAHFKGWSSKQTDSNEGSVARKVTRFTRDERGPSVAVKYMYDDTSGTATVRLQITAPQP